MRFVASVEYFGKFFSGWQKQKKVNTIQGEIEKAIFNLTNLRIKTYGAGRTDSGVHALGQIFHFDLNLDRPMKTWVKGLNSFLPEAIRIKWVKRISVDFNARHSAYSREYQYLLLSQPIISAMWVDRCGWTFYPLDFKLLKAAAKKFIGRHDFNAFRSSECQSKSSIRTISSIEVDQFNNFFLFTFVADGFLHHQIRNMMATIIKVGNGKMKLNYIETLFINKNRHLVPPTFSPNGLYLTNIKYDKSFNLPDKKNTLNIFDKM